MNLRQFGTVSESKGRRVGLLWEMSLQMENLVRKDKAAFLQQDVVVFRMGTRRGSH